MLGRSIVADVDRQHKAYSLTMMIAFVVRRSELLVWR